MKIILIMSIIALLFGCNKVDHVKTVDGCLIDTEELFVEISEKILIRVYGESNILEQKPYKVGFTKDSIWTIEGKSSYSLGGNFYLEMNCKNGEVIKIEHSK